MPLGMLFSTGSMPTTLTPRRAMNHSISHCATWLLDIANSDEPDNPQPTTNPLTTKFVFSD